MTDEHFKVLYDHPLVGKRVRLKADAEEGWSEETGIVGEVQLKVCNGEIFLEIELDPQYVSKDEYDDGWREVTEDQIMEVVE